MERSVIRVIFVYPWIAHIVLILALRMLRILRGSAADAALTKIVPNDFVRCASSRLVSFNSRWLATICGRVQ